MADSSQETRIRNAIVLGIETERNDPDMMADRCIPIDMTMPQIHWLASWLVSEGVRID